MRGFEGLREIDRKLDEPGSHEDACVLRDELQQQGLPFDRRLAELREPVPERFGLGVEEFVFSGLQVLGLPKADWFHRAHRVQTDWTHGFEARFWISKDRGDNHDQVEQLLSERFGPPERRDAGNHRRSTWGRLLQVYVSSSTSAAEAKGNQRLRMHPELLECARVDVYAPIPRGRPDPAAVIQRRAARNLEVGVLDARADRRYFMLHPGELAEETGIWVDDTHLGYSLEHCSLIWPRTAPLSLLLTEVRAARGPGSATLAIQCGSGRVGVAGSDQPHGLRTKAAELSDRLGLPVETQTYDND